MSTATLTPRAACDDAALKLYKMSRTAQHERHTKAAVLLAETAAGALDNQRLKLLGVAVKELHTQTGDQLAEQALVLLREAWAAANTK